MANRNKNATEPPRRSEISVPLLILLAFGLGVLVTWLVMRGSTASAPTTAPAVTRLPPPPAPAAVGTPFAPAPPLAGGPPDVSQLSPADAALTLGNWNYDRQSWAHAIEHYEEAIARGADNPDVRTDLGNCYRFLEQPQKALEQYELAQKQNPRHENSLFNQISLYGDLMHNPARAAAVARDFVARFPQSPQAAAARLRLQQAGAP